MKHRVVLLMLVMLVTVFGSSAGAEDIPALVRSLNALQNRIVTGDARAKDQAASQFDMIEMAIDKADPANWEDERNIRAAIVYLLCGGAPASLRRVYEARKANGKPDDLLNGSLEYAEAQDGGVPKALVDIDARKFPQMLGGHLALVQAGAWVGRDNAQAIALLDMARLLMPGSLVEEAALRREAPLLDMARESDKLALLSLRYATHYSASPYAGNFWETFLRMTTEDPEFSAHSDKFAAVLEKAPARVRTAAYLSIAGEALRAGRIEDAGRAVERASANAPPEAAARIQIYRKLLSALTDEAHVASLPPPDIASLNKDDVDLTRLVSGVLAGLSARKAEATTQDDSYEALSTVRRVIGESDALLKRAERR